MADYSGNVLVNPSAQEALSTGWTGYTNVSIVTGGFTDSCFRLGSKSYLEQTIPIVTFTGTEEDPVECDGIQLGIRVRFNNTTGMPIYTDILVYVRLQVVLKDSTASYMLPCPAVLDTGLSGWYSFQKDFEIDIADIVSATLKVYTISTDVQIDVDEVSVCIILGASATSGAINTAKKYSDYNIIAHENDITNSHLSIAQKEGLTGNTKRIRTIKLGLEDKIRVANNKLYDYKTIRVMPVIARKNTPIITPRYWQEIQVQTATNVTCTSIAVERSVRTVGKIWIAYISEGILTVKSAPFGYPIGEMIWTVEQTIPGCAQCAIEFDGSYERRDGIVEFVTDTVPYLFYTTLGGELAYQKINGEHITLVSSNVATFDALRGSRSMYGDLDDGLIIFYIYDGAVKYSQLVAGKWLGEQTVNIAPTNSVRIKAERLFDYRINLHVTDTDGVLWEIFSKMSGAGWNANEYISATLAAITDLSRIYYYDFSTTEYISTQLTASSEVLYALSPIITSVENIDNGAGNYGLKALVTFDERVFNEGDNQTAFSITDDFGGAWGSASIIKLSSKVLEITFADFNNANGTAVLHYTQGTLLGDVVAVDTASISFTPVNLIPTELPEPVCMAVSNVDAKAITVTFDMLITSADMNANKAAFNISSTEYNKIPEGTLSTKDYTVDSINYYAETTSVAADLAQASLTDAQIVDTTQIQLMEV